jgi:hypothetical protein
MLIDQGLAVLSTKFLLSLQHIAVHIQIRKGQIELEKYRLLESAPT